ncbi:hypothetical protein IFR05_012982 [Cadophora sp. M221]|nr:hypothetical protein IFR05_012982 [Cadophora sp. M221]
MLYGRRALKGLRKLGGSDGDFGAAKCLLLLIKVCQDEGNHDEEEAFTVILSNFEAKKIANPPALVEETQATQKFAISLAPAVSQLASGDPERPVQYQQSYPIHGKTYPTSVTSVEEDRRLSDQRKSFDKQSPPPIGNDDRLSTDAIDGALPVPNDATQSLPSPTGNLSTTDLKSNGSIIILGDESCGKTCFLKSAESGRFISDDNRPSSTLKTFEITVAGKRSIELLTYIDPPALDIFDYERDSHFLTLTCVSILAFSIGFPDSLEYLLDLPLSYTQNFAPHNPSILLGLTSDLRTSPQHIQDLKIRNQHPVTVKEAKAMKTKLGASVYLECSAFTGSGMKEAMEGILKVYMAHQMPPAKQPDRFRALFGKRTTSSS